MALGFQAEDFCHAWHKHEHSPGIDAGISAAAGDSRSRRSACQSAADIDSVSPRRPQAIFARRRADVETHDRAASAEVFSVYA